MSETKPQVEASAGLGLSLGGECCPGEPPRGPRPAQRPHAHHTGQPPRPWGAKARRGVRDSDRGWEAARWAPGLPTVIIESQRREIGTPL